MVILGLLFYIFRTNRMAQIIVLAVISVIAHLFDPTGVQWMMVFAAIPMYFIMVSVVVVTKISSIFSTQLIFISCGSLASLFR